MKEPPIVPRQSMTEEEVLLLVLLGGTETWKTKGPGNGLSTAPKARLCEVKIGSVLGGSTHFLRQKTASLLDTVQGQPARELICYHHIVDHWFHEI